MTYEDWVKENIRFRRYDIATLKPSIQPETKNVLPGNIESTMYSHTDTDCEICGGVIYSNSSVLKIDKIVRDHYKFHNKKG